MSYPHRDIPALAAEHVRGAVLCADRRDLVRALNLPSGGVVAELGLEITPQGSVAADASWSTNVDGVFVCGDMTRGQSLIVWAIAEGRSAAAAVDRYLMGATALPAPLVPGQPALR